MKPITISVVAGGIVGERFTEEILSADYIIGIDFGSYWLVLHTIRCDLAIGDFDSTSHNERDEVQKKALKIIPFPSNKNATDFELAIDEIIKISPKSVRIYGAAGSRLDQTMSAIDQLARLDRRGIDSVIVNETNEISVLSGSKTILQDSRFKYVSILSITEKIDVTLKGLRYDGDHLIIHKDHSQGVSNEIRLSKSQIIIHSGIALIIRSND